MTRSQFTQAAQRDGLELAQHYAAMMGVSLATIQLWAMTAR